MPACETPVSEIMDVLVELGDWLTRDPAGQVEAALAASSLINPLSPAILRAAYGDLGRMFNRASMEFQVRSEFGGSDIIDGWRAVERTPLGRQAKVRAFPARLIHVLAGNAPGVAAISIIRCALTKGVNLFKLPSNDPFTATMILGGLAAVAPGHPTTRSFSAAYWSGGDAAVEGILFRPQFFDKIVAWGGNAAIRSAQQYIGPGFELVSFDPKTSISLIGKEAHQSKAALIEAAEAGAVDVMFMDQQACSASRFQYVEGTLEQVDGYCAALQDQLGISRPLGSAIGRPLPDTLRAEIDGLRDLEGYARVWGDYDGRGVVIRSEEPVDFYPEAKVVNVVPVARLQDAVARVNVATQSVGVYPPSRKAALRNLLAAAGAQRVVSLGSVPLMEGGLPHDGFYPLHRLVRWVSDED